MQPVSPYAESDGRITRLYAAPRWVNLDGLLVPIEQAVTVQHDPASESYTVRLGKESIELRPSDPATLKAAITARQTGLVFGPVLDAAKAPALVNFQVNCTPGVQATASSWRFKDAGAPVGVFIRDWKYQFGDKCIVATDSVTLDMSEAKEKALAEGKSINLDPTVASGLYGRMWTASQVSFAAARTAWGSVLYDILIVRAGYDDPWWAVSRCPIRFDTSAYPNPTSVRLCARRSVGPQNPEWIRAMRCSFTMDEYEEYFENSTVQEEVLNGTVMNLFEFTGTQDLWASPIPLNQYAATADFDIGLIEEVYDRPNVAPQDSAHHFELDGCVPYLEITYGGAGGGAMALLGVGT